jgi:hypothetical protein
LSGPRPPVLPPPPPSPAAVPVVVCISHGPRRGAVWCGGGSEASRFVRVLKLSPPSPRRRRVQVLQRKACGRGRNYGQSIRFHTSALVHLLPRSATSLLLLPVLFPHQSYAAFSLSVKSTFVDLLYLQS